MEAEKERIRREQERNKKLEAQRLKAKEEAAKNAKTGLNQWKNLGLNQQALLDQLVKQQQQKARGSSSSSSNLNSQLGSASQQERFKKNFDHFRQSIFLSIETISITIIVFKSPNSNNLQEQLRSLVMEEITK